MEKKGKLELTWVGKYEEEKLEPRILIEDTWDMVCEAICKIEGFTYEPYGEFQGHSSENRFIHITEEFVNTKYAMSIMKNLGDKQSLLIYCKKNQADMILPENVEVKKIPKDLLDKCNFESEVQE